jgi:hypothetical protein
MDFSKNNNVFVCLIILVTFFLLYLSIPTLTAPVSLDVSQFENFEQECMPGTDTPVIVTPPVKDVALMYESRPYIDPKTGSIMDGPGYESNNGDSMQTGSLDNFRKIPPNYYFLDDGANGELSFQNMMCSKSCCSEQWPTPHKLKHDPYVCGNKDEFVPSKYYCNNTFQDSGCLCLPKKAGRHLYNRGGNGREWF